MTIRRNPKNLVVVSVCLLGAVCHISSAAPPKAPLPALTNTSVSIPWPELRRLLDAARPARDAPPVAHVFSAAEYTATVSGAGDHVTITARCDVNVLADKWALVPLGPAAAALRKVTVDGKPCPVVMRDKALHALLTGKPAGARKLQIEIEAKVTVSKGVSSFQLPLVPSPIVTVTTTVPRVGLEVRADGSAVKLAEKGGKTTAVSSHRGGAAAVISWRTRPARPRALPTRIYAETETLVRLDDALVRSTADVRLQIVHTAPAKVRLHVDPKDVVLSVTGDGVSGWQRADGAVDVSFEPGAAAERTVKVVTERDVPKAGGALALRAIKVDGAKRDRGTVAVAAGDGWEVRPANAGKDGADRIGVSELSSRLRKAGGAGLELAFRYREAPATVAMSVTRAKRLPARIYATTNTLATIDGGRIRCRAEVHYDIRHAGVDAFRVDLPAGVELLDVSAAALRQTQVVKEAGNRRTLVVDLKDIARGSCELRVMYEKRLTDAEKAPVIPILTHPAAVQDRGQVGIEVRGGLEVTAVAKGAERVDVKELSGALWHSARAPLLIGYSYAKPQAAIALSVTRHKDVDVLVAMSDVCEAATTVTPDGKGITKMMFVLRNNRKQFMTLRLPQGAEIWSAFVNDRPVTPVRTAGGDVLVPLVKSEEEDDEDDDDDDRTGQSYRARRDRRRREVPGGARPSRRDRIKKLRRLDDEPAADLKPYDVEIVFVVPKVKLADRGEMKLALPQCDIPTGHMAWAVFLPTRFRVVDAEGNFKEVAAFSLPFRHFADAEYARRFERKNLAKAQAELAQKMAEQLKQVRELAAKAKVQGVLPVRVEIPVTGQMSRFEKFLVVDETPEMTLTYRRKID